MVIALASLALIGFLGFVLYMGSKVGSCIRSWRRRIQDERGRKLVADQRRQQQAQRRRTNSLLRDGRCDS